MTGIERRCELLAITAAFALACASTPESVERTRADLRAAEADPSVASGASVELREARKAVVRLEEAAEDDDVSESELDHLAYIATQKIQIARTAATEEQMRREAEELAEKRDALRLRARATKGERAKPRVEAVEMEIERVE